MTHENTNPNGDETNMMELTFQEANPVQRLKTMLGVAGISDEQVVNVDVTIEYLPERQLAADVRARQSDVEEPEPESEPEVEQTEPEPPEEKESEPQAKVDIPEIDTGVEVKYGSRDYAVLKYLEQATDNNEWITPRAIAEEIDTAPATVSGTLGDYAKRDIAKRRQRSDMNSPAYEYKILILGREALRRAEQREEQDQQIAA